MSWQTLCRKQYPPNAILSCTSKNLSFLSCSTSSPAIFCCLNRWYYCFFLIISDERKDSPPPLRNNSLYCLPFIPRFFHLCNLWLAGKVSTLSGPPSYLPSVAFLLRQHCLLVHASSINSIYYCTKFRCCSTRTLILPSNTFNAKLAQIVCANNKIRRLFGTAGTSFYYCQSSIMVNGMSK